MASWSRLLKLQGLQMLSASGRSIADVPLSRVQQGVMYHCSVVSASLASAANFDMVLTTPASDAVHLIVEAGCGGIAELGLYEGVVATGGTSQTVVNQKRASAQVSDVAVVTNPSVSNAGTRLFSQLLPIGGLEPGTGHSFESEWILAANTRYLIRITNRVALLAQLVCIGFSCYLASATSDA